MQDIEKQSNKETDFILFLIRCQNKRTVPRPFTYSDYRQSVSQST